MGRARDKFGKFLKGAEREADEASKRASRGFWKQLAWGDKEKRSLYKSRLRDMGVFGMADAAGSKLAGLGMKGALGVGAAGVLGLRDSLKFDETLTKMDVSSKGAMGSLAEVRKRILEVSDATGVAKEDIAAGASSFVALTGDGKAASAAMETFARVQKATGAQTSQVASTAAALSQQLGVLPEDMENAFSVLARGGKEGAVEFSDMASLMASLAASFKGFGQSQGLGGVAQLGAMFQIAKQDFGSAAQTATGLERLMEGLSSPRTLKQFKKLGIEVFNIGKNGQITMRPMADLLADMAKSKLATDPRELNKAFESSEARRTARALLNNIDAVRELAKQTESARDIAIDYAKVQESSSARVSQVWNRVKVGVAEAFDPEVLRLFADGAEVAADRIGKAVVGTVHAVRHGIEVAGGPLTKGSEAKQVDALRLFKDKTGFSNEYIAKMSEQEIIAHANRTGILGQLRNYDIGGLTRGMSPVGIAEASKRESSLDKQLGEERSVRENTMGNILNRVRQRELGTNADAIRGGLSVTNQITLNGVTGDAEQIGNVVIKFMGRFWDQKMVELGAAP